MKRNSSLPLLRREMLYCRRLSPDIQAMSEVQPPAWWCPVSQCISQGHKLLFPRLLPSKYLSWGPSCNPLVTHETVSHNLTVAVCHHFSCFFCAFQSSPVLHEYLRSCGLHCFPGCNRVGWVAASTFPSRQKSNMLNLSLICFGCCAAHCKAQGQSAKCHHPTAWPPASAPDCTCACCFQALVLRVLRALTHKEKLKLVLGEILVALLEVPVLLFYPRGDVGGKR